MYGKALGIHVARPRTAVEGQIRLETSSPTKAANIPPTDPRRSLLKASERQQNSDHMV